MTLHQYLLVLGLVTLICLAETLAQICFKTAVDNLNLPADNFRQMLVLSWRLLFYFRVWLGMWLGLAILALWISVLALSELNFAFSLSGIHYMFVALGSKIFLGEHVSRQRWIATGIIAVGIAIVSISGGVG